MAKATQEKLNHTLDFIQNYILRFGYPPTVREICKELKVTSSATAQYYLDKLEEQGLIKRSGTKNRAIELVNKKILKQDSHSDIIPCPIINSSVNSGNFDITTCDKFLHLSKNSFMTKLDKNSFCFIATNNDLKSEGISVNDILVFNKAERVATNDFAIGIYQSEILVAKKENLGRTTKYVYNFKDYNWLNVEDFAVFGKLIATIRNF